VNVEDVTEGASRRGATAATSRPPLLVGLLVGLLVLVGLLALEAVSDRLSWDYFGRDPIIYRERMAEVFSGRLPYVEADFEHLPVMLVPMAAAWLLGGFAGDFAYRLIWAALSVLALWITSGRLRTLEAEVPGITGRWFLLASPLLLLVVFRNDVWVTLLAVAGMVGVVQGRRPRAVAGMVAGSLAKGWPIVLAVPLWRKGWRAASAWGAAGTVVLLGVVALLPGFSEGRGFTGLHTESLGGSFWGLWQLSTAGGVTLLRQAGAIYVDAPPWLAVPGLVAGAVLAVLAVRSRPVSVQGEVAGLGVLVCAILLASPLQSTQFNYWLTPFAAAGRSRRTLGLALAVGVSACLSLLDFSTLVAGGDTWWFINVLARNLLLLALALDLLGGPRTSSAGLYTGLKDV